VASTWGFMLSVRAPPFLGYAEPRRHRTIRDGCCRVVLSVYGDTELHLDLDSDYEGQVWDEEGNRARINENPLNTTLTCRRR
jgi:hypothetical protein